MDLSGKYDNKDFPCSKKALFTATSTVSTNPNTAITITTTTITENSNL